MACPLSRPVLNTCFRNVEPCPLFSCFVHLAVSLSLCCFVIRAQIEKCSQVALVSAEPVEELSFCQPIRKSAALFASFIVILCGVVLLSWCIAPSPLGKPCREQVLCPRTLNRANPYLFRTSRSAESFVWSIRVLCEVRNLFDPVLRALGEVRDASSGFSAHSVTCEQVLIFPAYSGSNAISCPTHLVTCLHRVFVVCKNPFSSP